MLGLGDHQFAATSQDANGLGLDERRLGRRVIGVDGDEPTLGLGHHLLGDHDDVAVLKFEVVRRQRGYQQVDEGKGVPERAEPVDERTRRLGDRLGGEVAARGAHRVDSHHQIGDVAQVDEVVARAHLTHAPDRDEGDAAVGLRRHRGPPWPGRRLASCRP